MNRKSNKKKQDCKGSRRSPATAFEGNLTYEANFLHEVEGINRHTCKLYKAWLDMY